jgi:sugar phosphate isomerase/epimerase
MMLGYNTWSMPTVGIDETIRHLAKLGYDSMELTICPGWPTDAALLHAAERRRIRTMIADHGLRLTGCTGNTPVLVDTDTWAVNRERLEKCLDFAADMRGDGPALYVATTTGAIEGEDVASLFEPNKHRIVERFGQLTAYAAARGATMHLEPHVSTAVRRPEQALWVIAQVGSPALRISLDISHFEVQGFAARDVVAALAPIAGAVEVKDERGLYPDFEFLIPGEGEMDYPGFIAALAEHGFTGGVAVEISKMCQAKPDYDPLAAAETSYRVLAAAFAAAGVARG